MGFIERLRQRITVDNQRYQQSLIHKATERDAQRQEEEKEKEFHKKRLQQAFGFRKDSGIGDLVAELDRILKEAKVPGMVADPNHSGEGESYPVEGFVDRGDVRGPMTLYGIYGYDKEKDAKYTGIAPIVPTDVDSVFDEASWDKKTIKEGVRGPYGLWDNIECRLLVIETCPDGNLIFHAGKRKTITEQEWRNNKGILDHALEQAFNNPKVHRYTVNHRAYNF